MTSRLTEKLTQVQTKGRLRRLRRIQNPQRPKIELDGRSVIDFCSNDYLGFSQHPQLIEASIAATRKYGVGTGGARLIGGTLNLHLDLEAELAQFKGTEAALVFNSGYQANVGILSGLIGRTDLVFSDRLNHASLVDGVVLSRAPSKRYAHNDLNQLAALLSDTPKDTIKWIISDSVFSMDGDCADIKTLYKLATQYNATLIIDEAHATGIFGESHRSGLWETTNLGCPNNVIQIGTFSKALGSFGAYVAASQETINALLQFSRSFIYSTSLPPGVIATNRAAIQLLQANAHYTAQLWDNIRFFNETAQQAGLPIESQSPIIPIIIGDAEQTLRVADALFANGFYVQAIRPPTVPSGTSRLRVTLSALHSKAQISAFIQTLHFLVS